MDKRYLIQANNDNYKVENPIKAVNVSETFYQKKKVSGFFAGVTGCPTKQTPRSFF